MNFNQPFVFIINFLIIINVITRTNGQTCSKDKACETKACCSQWGNCGYGPDFCGKGCLNACDSKPECGQYGDKKDCPLKVCCSQFGFCGTTTDFCSTGCQSGCETPSQKSCASGRSLLNIGYYASWSASRKCNAFAVANIDPRNYTHLNYAFGEIKGGAMVDPSGDEETKMADFVRLKQINPSLKVLISVGGWAFNDPGPTRNEFHNIAASSDSRAKFISSVTSYISRYGFDGIDIDWEYPGADDRGGSPEDTENYVKLVADMRNAFGDKYLITIAAPASYWYLRHFQISEMSKSLDWINIMTYDIHGVWDKDIDSLGPYVKSHTNIAEIKQGIDLFLRDGVPPEKIVLGLGLYGRAFTLKDSNCKDIGCEFSGPSKAGECTNSEGTLAWFEIDDIMRKNNIAPVLDQASMSQILNWDNNQWVAFDDDRTLSFKRDYASKSCFKGVMFWSIDQGIDRATGSFDLQRVGSIAHAYVKLAFDDSFITFTIDSTRDARDGFTFASLVVLGEITPATSKNENSAARFKRQSVPGKNTCSVTRNFYTVAQFFAALTLRLIYNYNNGIDRDLIIIRPNDASNPVEVSFLRRLPNGAQRVELITAIYQSRHLNLNNRVDFPDSGNTSTQYMRNNLDATTTDERGHLVGNFASGPPLWYNLVPQDRSVNRNYLSRWILNDWYNTERMIREHLQFGGGRSVRWSVAVSYANDSTGRPSSFTYEAVFLDGNGNQVDSIFGTLRNCPPGDGQDSNGRCVGM